jgi:hypothetical protein
VLQDTGLVRGERTAVEVRRACDLPPQEAYQLAGQAGSWHGTPAGRGFRTAPGRLGGETGEQCVLATATQDGTLRALLHFAPWGTDGLTLDLASRDRPASRSSSSPRSSGTHPSWPSSGSQ